MTSTEPVTITFASASTAVAVTLVERRYPHAANGWDRDVLTARVEARSHHLAACFETELWAHELEHLEATLEGLRGAVGKETSASFAPLEPALRLDFRLDRRGHLTLDAELAPQVGSRSDRLRLSVEVDQTFLAGWSAQVREAARQFPSTLEPNAPRPPLRPG